MHYNIANSYLFLNGTEVIKFKTDESKMTANTLCLGNTLKDTNAKSFDKTSLYGNVYDFSVDYDPIAADDVLDIHKNLMKKNGTKYKCLDLFKKVFV